MKRDKRKERKARSRILILCEGETEKNYFQAIKEAEEYQQILTALTVKVLVGKHPAAERLVEEAIQLTEKAVNENNEYDQVWVVFDHDNQAHRKKAYDKALAKNYSVAFSAIAFEIWYLLHFIKTAKEFENGEILLKELKKHYPSYEKAKQNDFTNLKYKLLDAKKNSEWLRNQIKGIRGEMHVTDYLSWTDVDELVFRLINQPTD